MRSPESPNAPERTGKSEVPSGKMYFIDLADVEALKSRGICTIKKRGEVKPKEPLLLVYKGQEFVVQVTEVVEYSNLDRDITVRLISVKE